MTIAYVHAESLSHSSSYYIANKAVSSALCAASAFNYTGIFTFKLHTHVKRLGVNVEDQGVV